MQKKDAGEVSKEEKEKEESLVLFEYMLELKKNQIRQVYPWNLLN